MQWEAPRVRVSLPPHDDVTLRARGRPPHGSWWALLMWERHASCSFASSIFRVQCSAWTRAATISAVDGQDYMHVPRILLDADPDWWPPASYGLHYGQLEDCPLTPPAGMLWVWPNPRGAPAALWQPCRPVQS